MRTLRRIDKCLYIHPIFNSLSMNCCVMTWCWWLAGEKGMSVHPHQRAVLTVLSQTECHNIIKTLIPDHGMKAETVVPIESQMQFNSMMWKLDIRVTHKSFRQILKAFCCANKLPPTVTSNKWIRPSVRPYIKQDFWFLAAEAEASQLQAESRFFSPARGTFSEPCVLGETLLGNLTVSKSK